MRTMRTRRPGRRFGALGGGLLAGLLAAVALAGCGEPNTYVPPPPPEVTVARPEKRPVTETMTFTGNLQAVRTAELVARVPGFLEKVMFQDGQDVREDELLFVIEQAPYRAAVVGADAGLQKAEAELAQAKITTARLQR